MTVSMTFSEEKQLLLTAGFSEESSDSCKSNNSHPARLMGEDCLVEPENKPVLEIEHHENDYIQLDEYEL